MCLSVLLVLVKMESLMVSNDRYRMKIMKNFKSFETRQDFMDFWLTILCLV